MSSLKYVLFFSVFLTIPFVIAAAIAPSLFFGRDHATERPVVSVTTSRAVLPEPRPADNSFVSVASDTGLDPTPGKIFLVSLLARFEQLPREDNRQKLVMKYMTEGAPYTGWAFAVHRFDSSLRPEVYLEDSRGDGGWYTFDSFSLTPGDGYAFTIVYSPKSYLTLYAQEFVDSGSGAGSPPVFLGGYDVSDIDAPRTSADLFFGGKVSSKAVFNGAIANLLVAQADTVPEQPAELLKLVNGGPATLKDRLKPDDVQMWITASGTDESRFARAVKTLPKT